MTVLFFTIPPGSGNLDGGCLSLRYDGGAWGENEAFGLRNISILCDCAQMPFFGVELRYTGPPSVIGAYNKLYLDNVEIGSFNRCPGGPPTGYFRNGLFLRNSAGVQATNLSIYSNADIDRDDDCEETLVRMR